VTAPSDWERELLAGLPSTDVAAIGGYLRAPRACCGRPRSTPPVEVACAFGNCVEWRCACGASHGTVGPVGCPCQDDPAPDPTIEEAP
jgi:hypothetical protein